MNDLIDMHASVVSQEPKACCEFVCECSDDDCSLIVMLPVARYRAIREEGYYLIAAAHEAVNRDRVVADEGTWLVIR